MVVCGSFVRDLAPQQWNTLPSSSSPSAEAIPCPTNAGEGPFRPARPPAEHQADVKKALCINMCHFDYLGRRMG